jgi:hypothetical protein
MPNFHTPPGPDDHRLAEWIKEKPPGSFDPATMLLLGLWETAKPGLLAHARRRYGDDAENVLHTLLSRIYWHLCSHYGMAGSPRGKAAKGKANDAKADEIKDAAIKPNLVYIGKSSRETKKGQEVFLSLADWLHERLAKWGSQKPDSSDRRLVFVDELHASVASEIDEGLLADDPAKAAAEARVRKILAGRTATVRFIVESHWGIHEDLTFSPEHLRERCLRAEAGAQASGVTSSGRPLEPFAVVKRARGMGLDPSQPKLKIKEIAKLLDRTPDYVTKLHRAVIKDARAGVIINAPAGNALHPPVAARKDRARASVRTQPDTRKGYGIRKAWRQPSSRGSKGVSIPETRSK